MQISLMVEGQNGLTWERWSHILALAERLGFPGLYRSDHYFVGQQQDSLETYLSFVMAASETSNIRFGPLVTPITFRAPVNVGRMGAQIDDGRISESGIPGIGVIDKPRIRIQVQRQWFIDVAIPVEIALVRWDLEVRASIYSWRAST